MNFFRWLLRRKSKKVPMPRARDNGAGPTDAALAAAGHTLSRSSARFPKLTETAGGKPQVLTTKTRGVPVRAIKPTPAVKSPKPPVDTRQPEVTAAATAPLPGSQPDARRHHSRIKTRTLGFEAREADVVPLFDTNRVEDEAEAAARAGVVMFPTGWLIIKQGAGRGATFPLMQGVSQIGRGTDQTISLDFGDMSVSRSNHAAIAYDAVTHQFHVGHGGKSNLVRLNGKPLLTTEALADGDEIQIGETTLVLKVLCTAAFNWSSAQAGGDGHDMAIA